MSKTTSRSRRSLEGYRPLIGNARMTYHCIEESCMWYGLQLIRSLLVERGVCEDRIRVMSRYPKKNGKIFGVLLQNIDISTIQGMKGIKPIIENDVIIGYKYAMYYPGVVISIRKDTVSFGLCVSFSSLPDTVRSLPRKWKIGPRIKDEAICYLERLAA